MPATTSSLEAYQAYSLGRRTMDGGDYTAAIPLFQRAIRLDPNLAMAYASLGQCYANLYQTSLAIENTKKAYELRDRVSNERGSTSRLTITTPSPGTWKKRARFMNSGHGSIRVTLWRTAI